MSKKIFLALYATKLNWEFENTIFKLNFLSNETIGRCAA